MERKEFFVFAEATEILKQRELYEIRETLEELKNRPSAKNKKFIRTNQLEDYVTEAKIAILEQNEEKIIEKIESLQLFYRACFTMEYNLIYMKKNNFMDYIHFRKQIVESYAAFEA